AFSITTAYRIASLLQARLLQNAVFVRTWFCNLLAKAGPSPYHAPSRPEEPHMISARASHRNARRRALSRRACVSALAALAVAPTTLRAQTQIPWHTIDIWKPYRREDLGFEVELPGEP